MPNDRILIHCDLDAFFAAVEVLHHGFDDETPLIIGSDPKQGRGRGIVSTCNYAARVFGIRSAMPISEVMAALSRASLRLCSVYFWNPWTLLKSEPKSYGDTRGGMLNF